MGSTPASRRAEGREGRIKIDWPKMIDEREQYARTLSAIDKIQFGLQRNTIRTQAGDFEYDQGAEDGYNGAIAGFRINVMFGNDEIYEDWYSVKSAKEQADVYKAARAAIKSRTLSELKKTKEELKKWGGEDYLVIRR